MLNMTFNEVYFFYKLEERAIVEDNIVNEKQKADKAVPVGRTLSRLVDKKIRENREEVKRINGNQ